MKVLLVDDSRTIRRIQKNAVESMGDTEVAEAADGREALDKCAEFKPDLILLDWNMPVMDGLTFVKTYRGAGNKTPIIMCTTEAEKARVIEAIKNGVNNYVVKPFTIDSLCDKIKQTLAALAAKA